MLGHGDESRSWFGLVLARSHAADYCLKRLLLNPVFPGGLAQALVGILQRLWNVVPAPGVWGCGGEGCLPTPTQKILFTSSQVWSWQPCSPCPQPASLELSVPLADNPEACAEPHATPTHFSLIPSLLPCRKPLPAAHPDSQPALFLQGFWRPQGHTALSGNYSSGQFSLTFLSSEFCIFLPLFGGDLVAGQPSRASVQGEAQPNSLAPFTGAGSSSCPSSLGASGDQQGWTPSCLGRELKLCFSFQSPREEFFLRCFCRWGIFLLWR